jgi:serine/threonine protein kinase
VVKALDAGTTPTGVNYFMMEFVDGDSLENIRTERPEIISTKFLLNLASQLSGAMDYAWTKFQMIHGDIKPGNMIIRAMDNELKICDLGLARSGSSDGDPDDDVMVTPLYAAPEVIRQESRNADPRSDIYSFGVLLYELSCGAAPFQGSLDEIIAGHLSVTPEPLIRQNPDMDREMAEFIDRMIAKSPDDCPADWKEVRTVFGNIRKRLYPPATTVLNVSAGENSNKKAAAAAASWGENPGEKKGFFAQHPLILPAILFGVIAAAVMLILIQIL